MLPLQRRATVRVFGLLLLVGCGGEEPASSPTTVTGSSQLAGSRTEATAPAHPREPRPTDWFEDITARSGIKSVYRSGREAGLFTILETVGGGVAMLDFDRDDEIDLFFPGGGEFQQTPPEVRGLPGQLFRNASGMQFVEVSGLSRINETPADYSHGATVVDFNLDGWPDLFVTCFGNCRLLRNDGCGGFDDVTESSGLSISGWSTAAAWGDADHDGCPDVFVTGYLTWSLADNPICFAPDAKTRDVCPPQRFTPAQDRVFRNSGDGRFDEQTQTAGLRADGKGLGVVAADVNEDGWLDFYVANDVVANHLYLGAAEFQWREVGLTSGAAVNEFGAAEGSMGVDFCDFDGDGHGDLWVTNFELEDNSLYRGSGQGLFTHSTMRVGLGGSSRRNVGFGTGWADFNGDGWTEPFVVNGHVLAHSPTSAYRQPAVLYRSQEGKRFIDVTSEAGPWFDALHAARGAAIGDLDHDGAIDLVVVEQDEPATVLRNRQSPTHWIGVQLIGVDCDRDAIGARLSMTFAGRTLVRWITSGAGYLSQFDSRCLFPIDGDHPVDLTIDWPGGASERFTRLAPRTTQKLIQGHGTQIKTR